MALTMRSLRAMAPHKSSPALFQRTSWALPPSPSSRIVRVFVERLVGLGGGVEEFWPPRDQKDRGQSGSRRPETRRFVQRKVCQTLRIRAAQSGVRTLESQRRNLNSSEVSLLLCGTFYLSIPRVCGAST